MKNKKRDDSKSTRQLFAESVRRTFNSWMEHTAFKEGDSFGQKTGKVATRVFYIVVITLGSPLLLLAFLFTIAIAF